MLKFIAPKVENDFFKIVGLLLVILLSRLPQILSDNLLIDGDEGIVGIMTLNFLNGEGYPFFFASQSYGLTIVEILFSALFFLLFGVSTISLKLAMLSLWSIGIVFFYKALRNLSSTNNWWPFFIVLMFLLFPSWYVWSMKARGGYITAFTSFSLLLYLLTSLHDNFNLKSFFIGLLCVVIYQAQPLWLVGLFPIFIYYIIKFKKLKNGAFLSLGMLFSTLLFFLIKINVSHFTKPPIFNYENISLNNALKIPNLIYKNLVGIYYYSDNISFTSWYASILVFIFLLIIFIILYRLLFSFSSFNLTHIVAISFIGTICYVLLLKADSARYLLPLSQLGFLLIYLFFKQESKYKPKYSLIIILLIGIISAYSFKDYKFENRKEEDFERLISVLKRDKKSHIYFKHSLLEWQVMFYANKTIKGRSFSKFDRFQGIVKEVDSMLYYFPEKVAIVDHYYEPYLKGVKIDTVINEKFIIRNEVNYEQLNKEGFTFRYYFNNSN